MARRLALVVLEHLTVALADGDEELVNAHRRVDGNFTTEKRLYLILLWTQRGAATANKTQRQRQRRRVTGTMSSHLDSLRSVLFDECSEALDSHFNEADGKTRTRQNMYK